MLIPPALHYSPGHLCLNRPFLIIISVVLPTECEEPAVSIQHHNERALQHRQRAVHGDTAECYQCHHPGERGAQNKDTNQK